MSSDHTVDFVGISAFTSRGPGYAVARKCLDVQAAAERHDPSLRSAQRVILHEDARPWFIGALGEIEVGRLLGELGPEWFVRHSVPIGSGTTDVDHLVIGPGGVFAINTKHHEGASVWVGDHVVGVNGRRELYQRSSRAEAENVRRRLAAQVNFAVPVHPVIVLLNPESLIDRRAQDARRVTVLEARYLIPWMTQQPHQLSETKLALLKLAAEEVTTWHLDPRAGDTLRVMQRFERLVDQVGPLAAMDTNKLALKKAAAEGKSSNALVNIWVATVIATIGFFVLRAFANLPCTEPTTATCLVPYFYMGLKPMLLFGIVVTFGIALAATLIWWLRRRVRR
jgi:hypothetical protein